MKKRAMKKYIPQGPYCYDSIEETASFHVKVRPCKWYCSYKDKNGKTWYHCKYLGLTQDAADLFLWDMVKECGEHDNWEE